MQYNIKITHMSVNLPTLLHTVYLQHLDCLMFCCLPTDNEDAGVNLCEIRPTAQGER